MYSDISQIAFAIDPFTCWLESVAIYSFNIGKILSINIEDWQYLATIGTFATASDLTSGSASLNKSS